jgi:hypothetical protein
MIAVDPHKAGNTAAVLDPVTKTVIETARFANTDEGYGRLAGFARRWEHRRGAVEGCHGGPVPGAAAGRGRGAGAGRAGEAGGPGAGVVPGPWPQDRQG